MVYFVFFVHPAAGDRHRPEITTYTHYFQVLCIDVLEDLQADLENLQAGLVTVSPDRCNSS
jgi:hypothetical protein